MAMKTDDEKPQTKPVDKPAETDNRKPYSTPELKPLGKLRDLAKSSILIGNEIIVLGRS
jgi:hypothetical protein